MYKYIAFYLIFIILKQKEDIMKKIIFFIIGAVFVPMLMSWLTAFVFAPRDYEVYSGFWWGVYLLVYILFPLLYRPKIKQKMSKPVFYVLIYAVIFVLTGLSLIYFN